MVKPNSSSTPFLSSTSTSTEPYVSDSSNSTTISSSSSKYKGVRKRKWGKWVSEIRLPNSRERIWLGSYDSAEKAARAFDAALYCLRGSNAKFNFPENPPEIAGGRSLGPHEIQAVAARFANDNTITSTSNQPDSRNDKNMNNVGTEVEAEAEAEAEAVEYTSSPSVSVSEGVAPTNTIEQVESGVMDWSSFLSMLDANQGMSSDYGFYPAAAAAAGLGDQLIYHQPMLPPPPPLNLHDDDNDIGNVDDQTGGQSYSQSSFLWNF